MLFKEIIAVNAENHTKHKVQNANLLRFKTAGTYYYHSALKGKAAGE
jgi:hypothetical protein